MVLKRCLPRGPATAITRGCSKRWPRTAPERLHDFVNDLYRYELRRLRDALLAGAFPKAEYYGRVVALRRRYPLLSLKPRQWLADG